MNNGRGFGVGVVVGLVGAAALGSAFALSRRPAPGEYSFFDPIIEVKKLLDHRYVEAPDSAKLQAGAINGMIEVLDDPYTVYVPPARTTEFTKDLTGEYVGIGAQVNIVEGWLTIVSPLEDSPAFKSGLLADDRVVEIDGKSTQGLDVEECVKLLSGVPGTPVNITIERAGQKSTLTIVRDHIKTRSVKGFQRDGSDASRWIYLVDPARSIGYLRLTQFTPGCADELAVAIAGMNASGGLKGLVLDLRWNPGGLLDEAKKIADLFLREGVIVSTKGRAFPEDVARAVPEGTLPDFPLAVLINGQSASASEVLSGALVENDRAIAVGTRSFGKGLVQSVVPVAFSEGGEMKITEQRYYLPRGRCIQRTDESSEWGVDPSPGFYVPLTDAQTIELLRVRRQDDVLQSRADGAANLSDPAWIIDHLKDPQVAAAVKAVQLRIDSGSWQATGQTVDTRSVIAAGELKRLSEARLRLERDLIRLDRRERALEQAAGGGAEPVSDLWADSIDLTGGLLTVVDKDGKPVATLKITGNNLERWLLDADVAPQSPPAEPPKP